MKENIIAQSIFFCIFLGAIGIAISDKYKFPGIIFYLIIGILFGQDALGFIQPSAMGAGVGTIITVFVCIILFEGGMSLNSNQFLKMKMLFIKDIVFSIIFIMGAGFLSAYYILGVSWEIALIFSSLIIVTGPTVIKPIIRHIPLKSHVKEFLNGESVLIDAIGAIIAIIMLEFVLSKQVVGHVLFGFVSSMGAGIGTGLVIGFFLYFLIMKTNVFPEHTFSFLIIAFTMFDFWVSEYLVKESGLISVMLVGIILSNLEHKIKENILDFLEKLTRIIVAFLFVLLSANFRFDNFDDFLLKGMLIVFIIILARIPMIYLTTANSNFSLKERFFISWIGPRGIIAMAVASILALKLKANGFAESHTIEILVFLLIATTVTLQGLSAGIISAKLNILEKGDKNIIILGINEVTLFLAEILKDYCEILFIDSNKTNCLKAKEKGFKYITGNAFDYGLYHGIELQNFSTVLSATENNEINILFCRFLKNNFGFKKLFATLNEKESTELSVIMKNENIYLAFGNIKSDNLLNSSYLQKIKNFMVSNHRIIFKLIVNNPEFLSSDPDEYPIPENCIILLIHRERSDYYLYHSSFKFRKNDEIYLVSSEKDASAFEKICYIPTKKP